MNVSEIARRLQAQVAGDSSVVITGIKPLELAAGSDLSFFAPTSRRMTGKLLKAAHTTRAGAVLVKEHDALIPCTQIIVPNPLVSAATIAAELRPETAPPEGIHSTAVVDPSAEVGPHVRIGAYCVIAQDVVIGEGTVIHPHVVVYRGARIGPRSVLHSQAVVREFVILGADCVIQNGVVIGSEGFGYVPDQSGVLQRIPHLGTVVLEDHVDLGANTTVDRATFDETRVGEGTKIDNLVMLGHNVRVGKHTVMCALTGISGSAEIGSHVTLGGQVGVGDHVSICDGTRVVAQSGVTGDITERDDYAGCPHRQIWKWRRESVLLGKLPEMHQRLRSLLRENRK